MAVELAAVRLLAPHFGDSAYVWTNVIGVILAALAAGAWFGGRLAAGDRPTRALAIAFAVAAGILIAVPLVAPPLGAWLVPEEMPLDAAMPALVRGSLLATVVLFAPPVWLLGAVSPLLVTAVVRSGGQIGASVGAVSAAGTIGSLIGTFATTHLAVPALGCRLTVWLAALLLAACAAMVSRPQKARAVAALLLLALTATALLPGSVRTAFAAAAGPLGPPPPGSELLVEAESRQQYLQVVRDANAAGGPLLALRINEGLDSFHSVAVEGSVLTGGRYYDWHAVAPLLAGDGRRPEGLRALSIGDAGGSFRRVYDAVHPGAIVDAVEIDATTVELGERWFAGRKAPGQVFVVDGRVFVEHATGQYHVLHVDAYAHQVYVPAHLASREFFAAARRRLLPGGVIACNVGGLRVDDPVLVAIAASMRTAFPEVSVLRVPRSRNYVLLGRDRPLQPASLAAFAFGDERLRDGDAAQWRQIVAATATPGALQVVPAGAALADDLPALDRLLHESYVHTGDPATVVAATGSLAVAAAEGEAFTALRAGDFTAVLAVVGNSQQPSPWLRLAAGDARWQLRHLHAAAAEYAAAAAMPADPSMQATIAQRQRDLAIELAPRQRADAVAQRNGWLLAFVAALFAAAVLWLPRRLVPAV